MIYKDISPENLTKLLAEYFSSENNKLQYIDRAKRIGSTYTLSIEDEKEMKGTVYECRKNGQYNKVFSNVNLEKKISILQIIGTMY